ncbi:MAG: PKD domain-containing protein [Thermoplasmata archaeon]|nr:PKD domain-containing protein [Thermoplasmata archaeon]
MDAVSAFSRGAVDSVPRWRRLPSGRPWGPASAGFLLVLLFVISGIPLRETVVPRSLAHPGGPSTPGTGTVEARPIGSPAAGSRAPRAPSSAPDDNGSFGSVAFSWVLANGSVDPGAVNQGFSVGPDQLLYVPANGTLWVAFTSAPAGEPTNVTIRNVTSGDTDVVTGLGNVSALVDDASTAQVFLTESIPGTPGDGFLGVDTAGGDVVRAPTPVGFAASDIGLDLATGDLWMTVDAATEVPGNVTVVDPATELVRAVVPVGIDPTSVTYDAADDREFVGNSGSDDLTVLNATDNAPVGPAIGLPGSPVPHALTIDPANGDLLILATVGAPADTELVTVDPNNGSVVSTTALPAGEAGSSVLADPDSLGVYVTAYGPNATGGQLDRWDPSGNGWTAVCQLAGRPVTQAEDVATDTDYIGRLGQVFLSTVNLSQGGTVGTLAFGAGPRGGAYDGADGRISVVNSFAGGLGNSTGPDVLDAIDPASGVAPTEFSPLAPKFSPAGTGLVGLAYDPTTARLFTAEQAGTGGTALAGDDGRWLANLSIPFVPVGLADDSTRSLVYYGSATGQLAGFDTANLTLASHWNATPPTVPWGGSIEPLAVDSALGTVLLLEPDLAAAGVSGLWIVNESTAGSEFVAIGGPGAAHSGAVPLAVVFDPVDGDAYVAERSGTVVAVNVTNGTVVASTSVGGSPSYLAFDPGRDDLLVTDSARGTLLVLNGTAASALTRPPLTLVVGPDPDGVTVDPVGDEVVVSDYGSGTLDAFSRVPQVAGLVPFGTAPNLGDGGAPIGTDEVGSPVVFHALAGGGVPPLGFTYSALPPGCATADTAQLVCRPGGPSSSTVTVVVTDQNGSRAEGSVPFAVVPTVAVGLSAAPDRTDSLARSLRVSANVTGGIPPFSYEFEFGDGSAPVGAVDAGSLLSEIHVFPSPGAYTATVGVIDAFGITATSSVALGVGAPMTGTLTTDPPTGPAVVTGTTVPLHAAVTGGLPPYTFSWRFANGSGPTFSGTDSPFSFVNVTLSGTGIDPFEVWVNDSAGSSLPLRLNLTVQPEAPGSGTAPLSGEEVGIVAGAAVVAAVGVAVVVWRNSRRRADQ